MDPPGMSLHALPTEIQNLVLNYLPNSNINPSLLQTFSRDVVEDQYQKLEKRAPTPEDQKLAYFARKGFDYGIRRSLDGRLLDEGLSFPILLEVGKKGDARMIHYLLTHGILNVDVAISGAILSHHNDLVRELVTTVPVYNLDLLIQAALDSDNLEVMRFLAARMNDFYKPIGRTNRTTYWLAEFYFNVTSFSVPEVEGGKTLLQAGFGNEGFENEILIAFQSELAEPLPFTYTEVERYFGDINGLEDLLREHVESLLDRRSRNFSRLEWLLVTADQVLRFRGQTFETRAAARVPWSLRSPFQGWTFETRADLWIAELFRLSSMVEAFPIFQFAKQYLGPRWRLLVDPIQNEQQVDQILAFTPIGMWFSYYYPVQTTLLTALIPRVMQVHRDNLRGKAAEFVISQHPKRTVNTWHLDYHPWMEDYGLNPPHFPSFDFRKAISQFLLEIPVQVFSLFLKYRLIELWNKYLKNFQPKDPESKYNTLLGAAIQAGLNDIALQLKARIDRIREEKGLPPEEITVDIPHPRLARELGKGENSSPLEVQDNQEAIDIADRELAQAEDFIARRVRGEVDVIENDEEEE